MCKKTRRDPFANRMDGRSSRASDLDLQTLAVNCDDAAGHVSPPSRKGGGGGFTVYFLSR
jgi:hypothetical protein